ncbi:MAG: hypothetical protein HXY18_12545 [Bryobacteraceae bacterium]|nr:hypothetical protein [Bryobacteraceae bacterium]
MVYKFAAICGLAFLPASSAEVDPLAIIRRSLDRDTMNFRRGREYTYQQQVVTRNLGPDGQVKKTESSTYDFVTLGDELYSKLIAKDGKPLTGKEAKDAERKFEETLRKRNQESPAARAKRLERRRKEEEEGRRFLQEIPEAFTFELLGEEVRDGSQVWVIAAEPRPGYRPKAKRADLLKKFRGRIWIDKQEYQWVRVEAETIDTVSFGLVLARLGKGAAITFEQKRVNDEIWLPSRATAQLNARVGLVKSFRISSEVTWSGYRKFQSDSRIVSVEELAEPARK